jgi:hypothetical protein
MLDESGAIYEARCDNSDRTNGWMQLWEMFNGSFGSLDKVPAAIIGDDTDVESRAYGSKLKRWITGRLFKTAVDLHKACRGVEPPYHERLTSFSAASDTYDNTVQCGKSRIELVATRNNKMDVIEDNISNNRYDRFPLPGSPQGMAQVVDAANVNNGVSPPREAAAVGAGNFSGGANESSVNDTSTTEVAVPPAASIQHKGLLLDFSVASSKKRQKVDTREKDDSCLSPGEFRSFEASVDRAFQLAVGSITSGQGHSTSIPQPPLLPPKEQTPEELALSLLKDRLMRTEQRIPLVRDNTELYNKYCNDMVEIENDIRAVEDAMMKKKVTK